MDLLDELESVTYGPRISVSYGYSQKKLYVKVPYKNLRVIIRIAMCCSNRNNALLQSQERILHNMLAILRLVKSR